MDSSLWPYDTYTALDARYPRFSISCVNNVFNAWLSLYFNEYVGNGVKSYISAGYAENKGSHTAAARLLTSVTVCNAIKAYRAELEKKQEITREYLTQRLQKLLDSSEQANDRPSALRACQLLGQSIAMFSERIVNSTDNTPDPLTEQELELYRKIAAELTRPKLVKDTA